jgi:hypothetical protein
MPMLRMTSMFATCDAFLKALEKGGCYYPENV